MTRRPVLSSAIAFVALLGVTRAHSIAQDAPAQPTATYEADWTQTNFHLMRMNPARDSGRQSNEQGATINVQVDISDLGNVVGLSRSLTITRLLDGRGQDVTQLHKKSEPSFRAFEPPMYQTRHQPNAQRPTEELSPLRFNVGLDAAAPLPEQLSLLEGYMPVLVAESTTHVDIPYKVSDQPTEIVPGLRLRFAKAEGKPNSYSYSLVADDRGLPQTDRYDFNGVLRENQTLPKRIVTDRYLIDDEGNRLDGRRNRSFHHSGGMNASGSGGGDYSNATGMRFEIASNVRVAQLPINVRNIDLPSVQTAVKLLPQQAVSPRELQPVDRMEEALARHLKKQREAGERIKWTDAKDAKVRELWDAFKKDHGLGIAAPLDHAEVKGIRPDVRSYDEYLGTYDASTEGQGRPLQITIRKDELGRLLVDTPEGPSPAIAKGGAIFAVFDDVMIAREKPLDPDSSPKLAGLWIVRSKGITKIITDTDRPMPDYTLTRTDAKAPATTLRADNAFPTRRCLRYSEDPASTVFELLVARSRE